MSANDDKILQTFDKVESLPYGTAAARVCKMESIIYIKIFKLNTVI